MSGFFIFTLIVSVKYLEIMIFDCLSSNLYLWSLHLWLFIWDLFICDSSSVISSSVTLHLWSLHLWSQYIWFMAWLEVWPFSWSVLISGELLYHIEKTARLVLWVLNTTINNISYVISWQVSLNDGKNTMVRHHPLPIVKWVVFLFSL
jgi:hypothetical protein